MELTFLRTFCRGANLLAEIMEPGISTALSPMKNLVKSHFASRNPGSALDSFLRSPSDNDVQLEDDLRLDQHKLVDLKDNEYAALILVILAIPEETTQFKSWKSEAKGTPLPTTVEYRDKLQRNGVVFATARKSLKNSIVQFRLFTGEIAAGRIAKIFLHQRSPKLVEAFVQIDKFEELSEADARNDPYRPFEHLAARLYYAEPRRTVLIRAADVVSHVACCPYTHKSIRSPCIVVLSLDRVSVYIRRRCATDPSKRPSTFRFSQCNSRPLIRFASPVSPLLPVLQFLADDVCDSPAFTVAAEPQGRKLIHQLTLHPLAYDDYAQQKKSPHSKSLRFFLAIRGRLMDKDAMIFTFAVLWNQFVKRDKETKPGHDLTL